MHECGRTRIGSVNYYYFSAAMKCSCGASLPSSSGTNSSWKEMTHMRRIKQPFSCCDQICSCTLIRCSISLFCLRKVWNWITSFPCNVQFGPKCMASWLLWKALHLQGCMWWLTALSLWWLIHASWSSLDVVVVMNMHVLTSPKRPTNDHLWVKLDNASFLSAPPVWRKPGSKLPPDSSGP